MVDEKKVIQTFLLSQASYTGDHPAGPLYISVNMMKIAKSVKYATKRAKSADKIAAVKKFPKYAILH